MTGPAAPGSSPGCPGTTPGSVRSGDWRTASTGSTLYSRYVINEGGGSGGDDSNGDCGDCGNVVSGG